MPRRKNDNGPETLSIRRIQILRLYMQRLRNKAIATKLNLSEETVKVHGSYIRKLLRVHRRKEAADWGHLYLERLLAGETLTSLVEESQSGQSSATITSITPQWTRSPHLLTVQHIEIMQAIANDLPDQLISKNLKISIPELVEHLNEIAAHTGATNRAELNANIRHYFSNADQLGNLEKKLLSLTFEGLSTTQISQMLGVSPAAIMMIVMDKYDVLVEAFQALGRSVEITGKPTEEILAAGLWPRHRRALFDNLTDWEPASMYRALENLPTSPEKIDTVRDTWTVEALRALMREKEGQQSAKRIEARTNFVQMAKDFPSLSPDELKVLVLTGGIGGMVSGLSVDQTAILHARPPTEIKNDLISAIHKLTGRQFTDESRLTFVARRQIARYRPG